MFDAVQNRPMLTCFKRCYLPVALDIPTFQKSVFEAVGHARQYFSQNQRRLLLVTEHGGLGRSFKCSTIKQFVTLKYVRFNQTSGDTFGSCPVHLLHAAISNKKTIDTSDKHLRGGKLP